MDNFQIETAQNISIQQQVAGIGERMLAFFVDICIYIAYVILVMLSLSGVNISVSYTHLTLPTICSV